MAEDPTGEVKPSAEEQAEFDKRLAEARDREERVAPVMSGRKVVWYPQEGSQTSFLQCPMFEVLYHGTRGPGKGLRVDQKVATPEGWAQIDELAIGDLVMGSNGKPIRVTGVYPQGKRPSYKMTFRDGRSIICDDQHLWYGHFEGVRDRVYQMWELLKDYRSFYIPTPEPIEWKENPSLPVDPYLLGLLLGDGSMRADGSVSYGSVMIPSYIQYVINFGFTRYSSMRSGPNNLCLLTVWQLSHVNSRGSGRSGVDAKAGSSQVHT